MENKIELLAHAEFLREHAGKILRYQTERDGDTFSAAFEFSIDGATCGDWHCDVTLMQRDGSKNAEARTLSDSVSIDVTGDVATLTVLSLPLVPFEILIRPYNRRGVTPQYNTYETAIATACAHHFQGADAIYPFNYMDGVDRAGNGVIDDGRIFLCV